MEARIGTKREDMPWIETEFDPEFREFITHFSETRLPNIYALLEKQAQLENEVKAIAQGKKQKAHRKRKAAD